MCFSSQSQTIRNIISKYWVLLTDDPILGKYFGPKPSITYRRNMSLRDSPVRSHFIDPSSRPSQIRGVFPCGNCEACKFSRYSHPRYLTSWSQRHLVNCLTMGVIYLLQCGICDAFYKTSIAFRTRILEHMTSATSGYFRTAIGCHFALAHNYTHHGIKFLPLMVIPPPDREGNWDQALLRAEAKWIFRIKSDQAPGLNEAVSFAPFL